MYDKLNLKPQNEDLGSFSAGYSMGYSKNS
jgi:hypothetical protein